MVTDSAETYLPITSTTRAISDNRSHNIPWDGVPRILEPILKEEVHPEWKS
jgi:hypothetical protein